MPLSEFQKAAASTGYSLTSIAALMEFFGSSFEATVFRLASGHPSLAVSGLLRYRLRLSEECQKKTATQTQLFFSAPQDVVEEAQPKYRRQSLHMSEACTDDHMVRWNKSFPEESIIYSAATSGDIQVGFESLPNQLTRKGRLEAVRAPYQRTEPDSVFGDVLFFSQA